MKSLKLAMEPSKYVLERGVLELFVWTPKDKYGVDGIVMVVVLVSVATDTPFIYKVASVL